jgi:hypothetical protein
MGLLSNAKIVYFFPIKVKLTNKMPTIIPKSNQYMVENRKYFIIHGTTKTHCGDVTGVNYRDIFVDISKNNTRTLQTVCACMKLTGYSALNKQALVDLVTQHIEFE